MSLAVIFRPAAEQELREAHAWYEERHPGLGEAFLTEVDRAAGRIRESPELYAEVHGPIRRALVSSDTWFTAFRMDCSTSWSPTGFSCSRCSTAVVIRRSGNGVSEC